MYAKDMRPPSRKPTVTPPRNYGGTAFFESQIQPQPKPEAPPAPPDQPEQTQTLLPPPTPSPPEHSETESTPELSDCDTSQETAPVSAKPKPPRGFLSSLIPPAFSDGNDADGGMEELLLVGLIFLLSRGEQDNDILLILALLLLYR